MLSITIKNVFKNKVLYFCLAAGFILSIAIVSAVPTYVASVLDNYINSIFVQAQNKIVPQDKKYVYPASSYLSVSFGSTVEYDSFNQGYSAFKSMFLTESKKLPIPVLAEKTYLSFNNIRYTYFKDNKIFDSINNKILSISDFSKHISITRGRQPDAGIHSDNAIEVIVDSRTFDNFNLELDKTYEILHVKTESPPKIKVVGIFEIKDINEPYWLDKDTNFYCKFMTLEDSLIKLFENNNELGKFLSGITLEIIYDYNKIDNKNAKTIYEIGKVLENNFIKRTRSDVTFEISDSLKTYVSNEKLYSTVMWIFLVPIILVVMYYIWMISELLVDSDKEQIAVLRSRGASQIQILRQYFYDGLLLSFAGLAAGPALGIAICKGISYSDGFLEFSSLQGIKITVSKYTYFYAIITVLILLGTLLASVFLASQKSIIEVKQNKNRYFKILFKNKYLDFILIAISLYGYYNYSINKNMPVLSGINSNNAPLDPLLYLLSTIFIVGTGMLLLRLYKYIITLVFLAGKSRYFITLYISMINVMKYHLKKSTAMLFVVITVALGIFNIYIAKDINTSYINTVKYPTGTDIIIKGKWDTLATNTIENNDSKSNVATYVEPSYKIYSKIDGVDKYTKVFSDDEGQASMNSGNMTNSASIIGIVPHEFGTVAYFDSSLLKTHWYNYLNNMTKKPNSVLISRGLSSSAGIRPGDTIFYKAKGGLVIRGIVNDVVDYWPGCSDMETQSIVIANFDYVFSKIQMRPYEIWLKKKSDVSNEFIYDSIRNNSIPVTDLKDLSFETYKAKTDIFLKGTNSVLNLGFFSIGSITILGFVVYWVLSLNARTLSFGIYRSLGLSSRSITIVLVIEQLLTLGISILIGVISGNLAGNMFIPLIKKLWYENRYVIPATNLQYLSEYLQLGILLAVIFLLSFFILARYIKRLKINQAIKLGDD